MLRRIGGLLLFDLLSALHVLHAVVLGGVCLFIPIAVLAASIGVGFPQGVTFLDFPLAGLGFAFAVSQLLWARRLSTGVVVQNIGLLIGLLLLVGVGPIAIGARWALAVGSVTAPTLETIVAVSRLLGLLTIVAISLHSRAAAAER